MVEQLKIVLNSIKEEINNENSIWDKEQLISVVKPEMEELYAGKATSNNEIVYSYKTIKLKPDDFIKKDLGNYKLNDVVTINNDFLENTKLSINSVTLIDSDNYKYTKCGNDENGTRKR